MTERRRLADMSLELIIVAPDDRSIRRSEMQSYLTGEALWRRETSDGRSLRLSVPTGRADGPDDPVDALSLEIPTPITPQLANEALALAEQVADRLGWRVIEPVSGVHLQAAERTRWVSELTAYVDEQEDESPGAQAWLAAALDQPAWWITLLAVVAFGVAAAVVLLWNISPDRPGTSMGAIGTALLVLFLLVSGAWRVRGSRCVKTRDS
ncbi:MAG TPA: hypothetical protein VFV49_00330 [Thermoanaerobaculia bacterium]|nr:hypothetical protein [Thermoanaerobaculia bacterium]